MNVIVCLGFVLGALSAAATVTRTNPRQRVTLDCGVNSYSKSLTWKHKDELIINIEGKSGFERKGSAAIKLRSRLRQSNLMISDVKKEDAGAFTCEADGISHVHTLLVVSVSARPSEELQPGGEVTLQCEVTGLTSDSPVKWAGPEGQAPEGSGTVHLNPVAASDNGTWECVFSDGGQEYREKLDIRVKDPVSPTSPPVRRSEDNNGTPCPNCKAGGWGGLPGWWLWAAAGAGCVVVLLLTALVIVLCRRIRRRKRKLLKIRKNGRGSTKTYCQCNCRAAAEKPQRGRPKARPSTLALKPQLKE